MSNFKLSDLHIKTESEYSKQKDPKIKDLKVSSLQENSEPQVQEFSFRSLKESSAQEYDSVKARFGALAATDAERASRVQKDRRFSLNPLLREPLSVEQEETRAIEQKVQKRVKELADESKAVGRVVGYEEGWKRGYAEAIEKVKAEGSESIGRLNEFLVSAENCREQIFKANESFLIELVFRISRMVLLKELTVDPDYILRLFKEIIGQLGTKENILMRISKEDAGLIESLQAGLIKSFGPMKGLNIQVSDQLGQGSCQVETEWSTMDGSIDKQLQGIYEALFDRPAPGGVR